ncbi:MAG: SMP-30/gluconolactonase/LRE family protein [Wenzhouxiangella sp.]|jgi:sugar lactone lactonase YvrE|nr:SMP-30/gluconolactonase/LRE family protein [Wenzhouxiangella sp.]
MTRICLAIAALVFCVSAHSEPESTSQTRAVVETAYAAFARGDTEAFAGLMAPEIVWKEAEGNPYADLNPYIGPEAVMAGLMSRLLDDWEAISVAPRELVVEGDRVVAFGRYKQTWKVTGKTLDIPFVHSWTVQDGKIVAFQQYTDTAALVATMDDPSPADGVTQSHVGGFEQVALVPADRSLVRPEDGVMLADGTLLVADQVHGLVALGLDGDKRAFGDFEAAGYVHDPPDRSAGPNGVALEPDGVHVLVADVLTGAIYRVNSRTEQVVRIHQHEFGVNSARRDRSGAVWFTQSTENNGPDSEARMFAAVDTKPMDGALFRLSPTNDHEPYPELQRKDQGLDFANGLAIDEERGYLYVAETMADRILGYRLSVLTGKLSNRRVIARVPTPDNIELDAAGRLWVASPIGNALLIVEPETGEWSTVFHPRTRAHDRLMLEWRRRTEGGEPRLELFGPEMWAPLPGLLTGVILTSDDGPVYLTGLGNALVQLTRAR